MFWKLITLRYGIGLFSHNSAALTAFQISKNITQLFDRSDHPSDSNSAAIDPTSTLEKCVQLLEALRARDIVQPADLHRLEKLVKEDAKKYVRPLPFRIEWKPTDYLLTEL